MGSRSRPPPDSAPSTTFDNSPEYEHAIVISVIDGSHGDARRRRSESVEPCRIPTAAIARSRGVYLSVVDGAVANLVKAKVLLRLKEGYLVNPDFKTWCRSRLRLAGLIYIAFGFEEAERLLFPNKKFRTGEIRSDPPHRKRGHHMTSRRDKVEVQPGQYPGYGTDSTQVQPGQYPGYGTDSTQVQPGQYPGYGTGSTLAPALYRNAREEENSEKEEKTEGEDGAPTSRVVDSAPEAPGQLSAPATATGFTDGTGVAAARERRLAVARWAGSIFPDRLDWVRAISQGDGSFSPDAYLVAVHRLRTRPDARKKGAKYFLAAVGGVEDDNLDPSEVAAAEVAAGLAPRSMPGAMAAPARQETFHDRTRNAYEED